MAPDAASSVLVGPGVTRRARTASVNETGSCIAALCRKEDGTKLLPDFPLAGHAALKAVVEIAVPPGVEAPTRQNWAAAANQRAICDEAGQWTGFLHGVSIRFRGERTLPVRIGLRTTQDATSGLPINSAKVNLGFGAGAPRGHELCRFGRARPLFDGSQPGRHAAAVPYRARLDGRPISSFFRGLFPRLADERFAGLTLSKLTAAQFREWRGGSLKRVDRQ